MLSRSTIYLNIMCDPDDVEQRPKRQSLKTKNLIIEKICRVPQSETTNIHQHTNQNQRIFLEL